MTIFTLTIDPATGEYVYTQHEPVDHPGVGQTGTSDVIWLKFGVTVTDYEGDTATGFVQIDIRDDGPTARNDSDSLSRTETTETGNVLTNDDSGADDGTFVVTNPGTYNGTYGTLVLRADGSYTYTRNGQAGGVDTFNYTVRDADGDTDSATLTINVAEDHNPTNITGSGATDDDNTIGTASQTITGTISVNYHGDGAGRTDGNGSFNASGNIDTGTLRHNGNVVNVTFNASNDTYTGTAGGVTVFTMKSMLMEHIVLCSTRTWITAMIAAIMKRSILTLV